MRRTVWLSALAALGSPGRSGRMVAASPRTAARYEKLAPDCRNIKRREDTRKGTENRDI